MQKCGDETRALQRHREWTRKIRRWLDEPWVVGGVAQKKEFMPIQVAILMDEIIALTALLRTPKTLEDSLERTRVSEGATGLFLEHALWQSSDEIVRSLIDSGLATEETDKPHIKLCLSIRNGDTYAFRISLEKPIDLDILVGGFTPLMYAIKYRKKDMCIELLEKGASPNTRDRHDMPVLEHVCAEDDWKEYCSILSKHGLDLYRNIRVRVTAVPHQHLC